MPPGSAGPAAARADSMPTHLASDARYLGSRCQIFGADAIYFGFESIHVSRGVRPRERATPVALPTRPQTYDRGTAGAALSGPNYLGHRICFSKCDRNHLADCQTDLELDGMVLAGDR